MQNKNLEQAIGVLYSAVSSLTFFWVLNILKGAYPGVKATLNFYPPMGPLLGLFLASILVMGIALFIFRIMRLKNQKSAFLAFCFSIVLFSLMVFPPIFEVVVAFLK
ncbi:MAG: hypothetical protein A3B47_04880 [Candidatus Levybacteria bacterium RIFCSPLOWO2_01_FULL_39_24]|nr:MAG: hypothetical protein A2800_04245 [Candidatus Levybacteria bacterium RIFCSPHIGHO2_01_FULL_40_16]OGH27965.1 MAG: hypothetical protein A3E12_02630 [Candidatus Levybacteria bacterium RIFCSPHIGHO2_12_FULL_39_9]OGH46773.1 MAG: hypothetical protein A3B47_04880 [Candidatus Levybacteria bacterium RIFCSPLOWO2_01_FULL_39_24]